MTAGKTQVSARAKKLKVADLVLIADDNVNRNQWPLGRIVNVYPGVDNLVRSAELQAKGTTLRRGYRRRLFSRRFTFPFCQYLGHVSSDAKSLCLFH